MVGCRYDNDLHTRSESRWAECKQPGRIGVEQWRIPIHRGLISSSAGLAAFAKNQSLDNFFLGRRYYVQFCVFDLRGFTPIRCREGGSILYG